ncbi:MAG TPA: hypothetical protein PLD23_01595 [Armatimonadota bacterium]|nr:hypothetical protein [Armatimonadota bacterium]
MHDHVMFVGDQRLTFGLSLGGGRLRERDYRVSGTEMAVSLGEPWVVEADGEALTADHGPARVLRDNATEARFVGENHAFGWELAYQLLGAGRVTKTLTLTPRRRVRIERVWLWSAPSPEPPGVARTGLQEIAAFYRQGADGLFVSLDFPWSRITATDGEARVGYVPFDPVAAGEVYTCHSLTVGATRVTGRVRHGFHEGEVDAVDAYVQERFAPRFNRPLFSTACINNRYTQVEGDWVFYSMRDHPTLTMNRELLRGELRLSARLGLEYYQVFPGVFDWGPDDPSPEMVREAVEWAHDEGIRMGDYSGANVVFCGHYNQHRNRLDRPEWRIIDANGNPGAFCLGHPDFVDHYAGVVARTCRRFGFELHALDFLSIAPCHADDHGHPPGPDSVYHQVRGLVRFMDEVNAVSPEMLIWPNSGNWSEFLPKLAWWAPSLYLTDPFVATPWQGLNQTRILDDCRREQMVGLHHSHFVPYRFFTNCQYFFSQNSVVPDARGHYEYGALSTLAVTPNLCLAEVRPWLDGLSATRQKSVTAFYAKWTAFIREHYRLWTRTHQAGEEPGPGAVEIYGHAEGDRGFVFVVNPQYWGRTVEVPLDEALGFTAAGRCEIVERYPTQRHLLTAQGPFALFGSRVPVHVDAQQVQVLEVGPAPTGRSEPRLCGVPGAVERTDTGYLVKVQGQQGTTARFALLLPEGHVPVVGAEVRCVLPEEDARQPSVTALELLATDERGALFNITFPREVAPTELREWWVRPGHLADGLAAGWHQELLQAHRERFPLVVDAQEERLELPLTDAVAAQLGLGPLARFCGAYIENAFSEMQEAWIDLEMGELVPGRGDVRFASGEAMPELRPLSALARDSRAEWWLQTRFRLPFMYTLGCEPAFDDHTILVLPFLPPEGPVALSAWINGEALEVRRYTYPRNRGFGCYYADLVGTAARRGDNVLTVHYQAGQ